MLGHQAQLDVHYTLAELAQQGHDGVLTGLCEIADYLDTQSVPIDYERRRGLTGEGLLPADDWVSICTQTGVHPGQEARLLSVRRYLYQRITGNDLRQAPESLRITTAEEAAYPWAPDAAWRRARAMAERHAPTLDLLPAFQAADAAGEGPLFYAEDGHWTPAGHKLAAETAAPFVAGLLRGS